MKFILIIVAMLLIGAGTEWAAAERTRQWTGASVRLSNNAYQTPQSDLPLKMGCQ